jgi:MFS transporter, MHS family, shikimate and dehydroshikimate transport protein
MTTRRLRDNIDMEETMTHHQDARKRRRVVVLSTLIGATVEWYDFFIFGTISALFLNELFFPNVDPLTGTLLSFMAFATAWIARPIGGVIAGHIGDRIGRKTVLYWSFILMGLATTSIGLLPTYDTAGVLGAILLVALRILQGLSVGGEYGGAVITLVEHAEPSRRGFYGTLSQIGTLLGLLLGTTTFFMLAAVDQEALKSWGWRIPFLLSAALLLIGVYIRSKMEESPDFVKIQKAGEIEAQPLLTVLRNYFGQFLSIFFAQAAPNTFFYMCVVFIVSYGVRTAGFTQKQMLGAVCVGAIAEICTLPLFGTLADRIGRRKVFVGGIVFLCLSAVPFFLAVMTHSYGLLLLGYVAIMGIGHSAALAAVPSLFAEMFPPHVRFTGLSAAYQLSGALLAGPLPIIATLLISSQGGSLWLFAGYIIAVGVVSLIAIMLGTPHYTMLPARGADRVPTLSAEATLR